MNEITITKFAYNNHCFIIDYKDVEGRPSSTTFNLSVDKPTRGLLDSLMRLRPYILTLLEFEPTAENFVAIHQISWSESEKLGTQLTIKIERKLLKSFLYPKITLSKIPFQKISGEFSADLTMFIEEIKKYLDGERGQEELNKESSTHDQQEQSNETAVVIHDASNYMPDVVLDGEIKGGN